MAAVYHYTTLQAIRKLANLQKLAKLVNLTGVTDGTNTVFTVPRTPIVDSNYDDSVDSSDIQVFVNGAVLLPDEFGIDPIADIDSDNGIITLTNAPANGATVKATYYFSPSDDGMVGALRLQAEAWLNRRVKSFINLPLLTAKTFPDDWKTIVEFRAAGIALVNDYGSSADTDLSSKDGYLKMNTAKDMLTEYISDIQDDEDADSLDPAVVSSTDQGKLFPSPNHRLSSTERFFDSPSSPTGVDDITVGF